MSKNVNNDVSKDPPIALLVGHRTVIAEVMGSNPVQACIFSGFDFTTAYSCLYNCDDQSCFQRSSLFYTRCFTLLFNSKYNQ